MPNVVCVTGMAVFLRPVSCMPKVFCVTGLAVFLRPVSCMPNVFCATGWPFVFVPCLVCLMLPVSLECLSPVSCVPSVASFSGVS